MKKYEQSGYAHLIAIIVVLSVVLVSALSIAYYKNYIQEKPADQTTNNFVDDDKNKETQKPVNVDSTEEPSVVVKNFLTDFLTYMAVSDNREVDFATKSTLLSSEFKNSIINPTERRFVSPIILAQNLPVSFTIGNVSNVGDTRNVSVIMNYGDSSFNLIYNLIFVDNQWKINGVTEA